MKVFDMHIHAHNTVPEPNALLSAMAESGISGGAIFSNCPPQYDERGTSADERISEVINWCTDNSDKLFPVLWIHPHEENVLKTVEKAVLSGIFAFKIICCDFYVYEKESIKLLSAIAETGKPVFFHSGILWSNGDSSKYNRPVFWESLMDIKNLRFSLAHCSWPWIDECIALYGEFAHAYKIGKGVEMFLDLTPGTPPIYRRELLEKLFCVGYDVRNNIMFGTDSSANNYNTDCVKKWLKLDGEIMDELCISEDDRKKIYHDNLLRFLGKTEY